MNNLTELRTDATGTGEESGSTVFRKQRVCRLLANLGLLAVFLVLPHPATALSQTYLPTAFFPSSRVQSGPMNVSDATAGGHSDVLAAGFGFQGAAASMITIRTYRASSGVVLSEESYDLNVRDEGVSSGHGSQGRIFAGGIGLDSNGQSRFLLRVYDAETGRFLWEGQLNLHPQGKENLARPTSTLVPIRPSAWRASAKSSVTIETHLSLRAVNPLTGGLVWEDKFMPGSRGKKEGKGIALQQEAPVQKHPIDHVFDLVVFTMDRVSGRVLWWDSFEQLDQINRESSEHESEPRSQTLPWGGGWTNESHHYLISGGRR